MGEFIRVPEHYYEDPLARIWTACAESVGFKIARSPDVYASTDGLGTIFLGTDEILDPDDCLAQMILHELCHALVEGEAGESKVDWGLDNTSGRDTWREYACLRLQAYLTSAWGLRAFLAPTTDFRVKFWNSLPDDPFAPSSGHGRRDGSCVAARVAAWRASMPRWHSHLERALEATARIVAAAAAVPLVGEKQPNRSASLSSLYDTAKAVPEPHPAGHSFVASWYAEASCGSCAWSFQRRGRLCCRHGQVSSFALDPPACARWEARDELACSGCGACCREAYDSVELGRREIFVTRHPSLVVTNGDAVLKVRRSGDRCAALDGGYSEKEDFRCRVYEDRPSTCRAFTLGSKNCLVARQRVGLSL